MQTTHSQFYVAMHSRTVRFFQTTRRCPAHICWSSYQLRGV